jgi:hypothetical protein
MLLLIILLYSEQFAEPARGNKELQRQQKHKKGSK